jgi:hypothetical protein
MPKKKQPIKVVFSKLGQYKSYGLAWTEERIIAIDERLKGLDELDTIIHEAIHVQNPKWPEIMVQGKATELAQLLWDLGYRKVDV